MTSELSLDANKLTDIPDASQVEEELPRPRELPQPLAEFKEYADAKWCYYSDPIEDAEIVNIQPKMAFRCQMTILMEARWLKMKVTPHAWKTERVLGSRSIGRFFEDTERHGQAVGNLWNDYHVDVPASNEKRKQIFALAESIFYTRCSKCDGKGRTSCGLCSGSGRHGGNVCSTCNGGKKVVCSRCSGAGGFRHVPTLRVRWFPRVSTWFYQNSFLSTKAIAKGQLICVWLTKQEVWSKEAAIEPCLQSIIEQTPEIPLKACITRDYYEKHLAPTVNIDNRMRRMECSIEQMNFQEVNYTLGENYVNKQDPSRRNTFRFCQYPGSEGQKLIYEEDYPLNCCGCCCGPKLACYSSCCNIL